MATIGNTWQQLATIGDNLQQLATICNQSSLFYFTDSSESRHLKFFLLENVKISAHLDYFAGKTRILPQLPSFPTSLSSTPVDF